MNPLDEFLDVERKGRPKVTVIQGEALKAVKKLLGISVDNVVTDPPFFISLDYFVSRDKRWRKSYTDLLVLEGYFRELSKEFSRVLKPHGHVLMFSDPISYVVFFRALYEFFDYIRFLVWYKGRNYFSLGQGAWRHSFEVITHAWNGNAFFNKQDRQDLIHYMDHEGGALIEHPVVDNKERLHPAQKPVGLIEMLLSAISKDGFTILDPFIGTGTTAIASVNLGMNCVGIEGDERYVKILEKRLKIETRRDYDLKILKVDEFTGEIP